MSNRLKNETSPYLLQHKDNPVQWYPWCKAAFERAKNEDKPIFLSIGYSACHWCHVLAHESFEDEEIAELLNKYFISIKVDKEERPDIDSVYMSVCQAFTGSGGWPTSIFMTAEKKPFFAGTYFPRTSRGRMIGMRELLIAIHEQWICNRYELLRRAEKIVRHFNKSDITAGNEDIDLIETALRQYEKMHDKKHGGFGTSPKFPTPHNILFLLGYYERYKEELYLKMAEHTLLQMYRGGMFDHIGFGFCRYSTDERFLVPHFEKMLYDNALMIIAYCKAYFVTKKELYLEIAEKTGEYILSEMTSAEGAFYSSQDADSEGEEGKYYLIKPGEIIKVLGEENGEKFNCHFDITEKGNFEGKNIPNLLKSDPLDKTLESFLPALVAYRKKRFSLHRDEKILTSWNSLMIAAMCELYLVSKKEKYLTAAKNADSYIQRNLLKDDSLFVNFYKQKRGTLGFLDEYGAYIFAQLRLYRATLEHKYLDRARRLSDKAILDFKDKDGGFYLYGKHHEELIFRPKESYDGAIPSGNSLMAYNLVLLSRLTADDRYKAESELQLSFLSKEASKYPMGHAMFLCALIEHANPSVFVTVVLDENTEKSSVALSLPLNALVTVLEYPTKEYSLKKAKTTYYVCKGQSCLAPTNDLNEIF